VGQLLVSEVKRRLQAAPKQWQTDTRDWLRDPGKLRLLMEENDAVFKAGRRSPQAGWQYLKYLAPNEGHAKNAKNLDCRISSPVFQVDVDRVGTHQYTNYREPVVVRTKSGRFGKVDANGAVQCSEPGRTF